MTSRTSMLPHWDMTVVYPSLDAPEFTRDFNAIIAEIDALVALFDAHQIDKRQRAPLDDAAITAFAAAAGALNQLIDRVISLRAYIVSLVATDSRNSQAQARLSEFQQSAVRLSQLGTRFTAWIGSLDVDALLDRSATAKEYSFMLRLAQRQAEHMMAPPEEALALELHINGGRSWRRLYNNLASH